MADDKCSVADYSNQLFAGRVKKEKRLTCVCLRLL